MRNHKMKHTKLTPPLSGSALLPDGKEAKGVAAVGPRRIVQGTVDAEVEEHLREVGERPGDRRRELAEEGVVLCERHSSAEIEPVVRDVIPSLRAHGNDISLDDDVG